MKLNITPDDFPAATKSTYLNTASVALMYRGCQQAMDNWNRDLAENGTINFNESAEQDVFVELHHAFAKMLGAVPEDIAVASSATEQLTTLAWAVMPSKGSHILTTGIVFPTTIYPFSRVARHSGAEVRFLPGERDYVSPHRLIEAINEDTSVVCISHVEFGSGQCFPLKDIAEVCHRNGALLIVDATQSAGAISIDAYECGADAIICGGYKWLCGPFGASVMYVARELQKTLDPGIIGFRSNRNIWKLDVEYQDYPDTAQRFEFSTMAYGCAKGLAKSIEYLNEVGVSNIQEHNLELSINLTEGLLEMGAEVISPQVAEERTSIVSARLPGVESRVVVSKMGAANIIISPRRDFFRISPHLYNTKDDIACFLDELKKLD